MDTFSVTLCRITPMSSLTTTAYLVLPTHSSSPHIIRMIELRRMRWVGIIAWTKEKMNAYRVLV
jgi:hypothetical protein